MKLIVEHKRTYTVDTDKERERIAVCFDALPEIQAKLYHLVELVEQQKWNEALAELAGEWWQGVDESGYPRLEYLGLVQLGLSGAENDYYSLVLLLANPDSGYRVREEA